MTTIKAINLAILLMVTFIDLNSLIFNELLDENARDYSDQQARGGRARSKIRKPSSVFFAWASMEEERLVKDLFHDYNRLVIPVRRYKKDTVQVELGISFIQLINIDERKQVMTSNVWLQTQWHDYQLTWEPAKYGGIQVLRLPPWKVWLPDIILYNNADGNYDTRYKSNVLVYNTGRIEWIPPAILHSVCRIDVTYFPFDQQTCELNFGSLTYSSVTVTLKLFNNREHASLSDYLPSGSWDLVRVPACLQSAGRSRWSPSADNQMVTFYIVMRRKTLFYILNLILPTVLLAFLCNLVFLLPAESGEKITLGISVLVSLVVLNLLISRQLPSTSMAIPLICKYLFFSMIINFSSIMITGLTLNFNFREKRRANKIPAWMRRVFLDFLPARLNMKRPRNSLRRANKLSISMQDGDKSLNRSAATQASEAIDFIAESMKLENEYLGVREDWKFVGMVIERLLLYVFTLSTTAGTLYIFLSAPHLFERVDQDKLIKLCSKS